MQILKRRPISVVGNVKAKHFDLILREGEYPVPKEYITFVGIDPGTRNMGLCFIQNSSGIAFDVRMPPSPSRPESFLLIQNTITYLMEKYWKDGFAKGYWITTIEDAAFGMRFGQVQLAESRCSAMMYFAPHSMVSIIAPAKIRKTVFGHGRIKAEEYWKKKISPNAGAALSCSLYGMLTYE